MKKILFLAFLLCQLSAAIGQTKTNEISTIENRLNAIQAKQTEVDKQVRQVSVTSNKNKAAIQALSQRNEVLNKHIDSLKTVCDSLQNAQRADRTMMGGKIQETNNTLATTQSEIKSNTTGGIVIAILILIVLIAVSVYLTKRIRHGTSSIDEIRKAQDALQQANVKMQEGAVKLDNKMIELCEKIIQLHTKDDEEDEIDHSLILKVADEITRIEINLSRMDPSTRGYKQLKKAIERVKDNFIAYGYEIR